MNYTDLHSWNVSPKEAVSIQTAVRKRIRVVPLDVGSVRLVAGVDVSVKNGFSQAAIVVLTYPGLERVASVTHRMKTVFPYIPGLLTFREGPVIIECVKKLKTAPDVYIIDGQGLAHPRGTGLASHMGVVLGRPSVGSAKSHLFGTFEPPGRKKGDYSLVKDADGASIGAVLTTRDDTNPVFVSPGHLTDIPSSVRLVLGCSPRYKIPEPIRAAHSAASLVNP